MKHLGQILIPWSLVIFCMSFLACDKESETPLNLITEKWDLLSVENNEGLISRPFDTYSFDEAYSLSFENDTLFCLPTSVNVAGGTYQLFDNQTIFILTYSEHTEVATMSQVDKFFTNKLLEELPKVYKYKIEDKLLTFFTNEGEIIFRAR